MSLSMFHALILAVVQGLTEWLPVSSSGHLALSYMILGVDPPLMFNLAVHVGTLGAVVCIFRDTLMKIIRAVPRMLKSIFSLSLPPTDDRDACAAFYLLAATIPAAAAGYLLRDHAEAAFSSTIFLSGAFLFTGIVLLSTYRLRSGGTLTLRRSMLVGIAQILTIFPGVSRSGITISTGLHSGINRMEAARFSFLLYIPLIIGSAAFEIYTTSGHSDIVPQMVVGAIASFVVGIFSLKLLLGVISRGRFYLFAPYCLGLGIFLLVWSIIYA